MHECRDLRDWWAWLHGKCGRSWIESKGLIDCSISFSVRQRGTRGYQHFSSLNHGFPSKAISTNRQGFRVAESIWESRRHWGKRKKACAGGSVIAASALGHWGAHRSTPSITRHGRNSTTMKPLRLDNLLLVILYFPKDCGNASSSYLLATLVSWFWLKVRMKCISPVNIVDLKKAFATMIYLT
jgi:hypothetical protein